MAFATQPPGDHALPGEADHSPAWRVHSCPAPRQQPEGGEEAPRGCGRHSTLLLRAHLQPPVLPRARAPQMQTEQTWTQRRRTLSPTPSAPRLVRRFLKDQVAHVTPSPKPSKATWSPLLGAPQSTPPHAGLTHPASHYAPALCCFRQSRPPLLPTLHHTPPTRPPFASLAHMVSPLPQEEPVMQDEAGSMSCSTHTPVQRRSSLAWLAW